MNEVNGYFDWLLNKWVVSGFGMEAVNRSLNKAVAILMRMRTEDETTNKNE